MLRLLAFVTVPPLHPLPTPGRAGPRSAARRDAVSVDDADAGGAPPIYRGRRARLGTADVADAARRRRRVQE